MGVQASQGRHPCLPEVQEPVLGREEEEEMKTCEKCGGVTFPFLEGNEDTIPHNYKMCSCPLVPDPTAQVIDLGHGDTSDEEVWLRAWCAAAVPEPDNHHRGFVADACLEEFKKRFRKG